MNFQAVLAGLPDAVIAVDLEGRVVFWNAAAEELIARSARRAVGRGLKDLFPFEDSLIRRLHETLTTGESRSESETAVDTTDNRRVPVMSLGSMKNLLGPRERADVPSARAPLHIQRTSLTRHSL